jgi:hypothetical protein
MDKPVPNNIWLKRPASTYDLTRPAFSYSERRIKEELVVSLKTKVLALGIFLYFFIENGTLGLLPASLYTVYRSMKLSDFILYSLVIYSFINIKEYRELFKSKSLLIIKFILAYVLIEFALSAIRYKFNIIEYFFRLKILWASFLIFPYLLLFKRNGLPFLIKIILPVALVSNILYILTALTGIPFLPAVSIILQPLPGGLEVYRVYGGTFFGEMFFLGFVYYWITKKFRLYQLFLAILFILPHILAFGRAAWAFFVFTIVLMVIFNTLKKREFRIVFRQAVVLCLLFVGMVFAFIKFIPDSDYYIDALQARIFQGQEDVKYKEGTYGTRVLSQNNSLVKLWLDNDIILGIGMHPMWVVHPETFEEQVYYNAFSDVAWPSVLAAYGLIGFGFAAFFQIYYIRTSFKVMRKYKNADLISFIITIFLCKLLFDSIVTYSFILFSFNLLGLTGYTVFYAASLVYAYELQRKVDDSTRRENVRSENNPAAAGIKVRG